MRIDHGSDYRVYYMHHSSVLGVFLCGGDKRTQQSDIVKAKKLAAEWTS